MSPVQLLLDWNLLLRTLTLGLALASLTLASQGAGNSSAVVGTISSSTPVTINGSEMQPSVAPSWPLAAQDEITTAGAALLQTANRDTLLLDANTRVRVNKIGATYQYIYVRQGGLEFDAKSGPVFVCVGNRLYVPASAARGSLRLDPANTVMASLDTGTFAQQGTRSCGPDPSADFLSGLPGTAGGTIGPPTGLSTSAKTGIVAGALGAAAVGGILGFMNGPPCAPGGCHFIPPSISPSAP
jgi:hypothetical protein